MAIDRLKLVVFDLDFIVWDSGGVWCDCLSPPFRQSGDRVFDSNGYEVIIYTDIFRAFDFIDELGIPIAAASRTNRPSWARELLSLHGLEDRFRWSEIYPSSKVAHFRELANASQAFYSEMLFFDDEMRNIDEVGALESVQKVRMRVVAGIFGFWQGVAEASMPGGPWPSAATQPKAKKDAAPKGFPSRWPCAALSALGISNLWIHRNTPAWRQAHLDENDAYSDFLDTLFGVHAIHVANGFCWGLFEEGLARLGIPLPK